MGRQPTWARAGNERMIEVAQEEAAEQSQKFEDQLNKENISTGKFDKSIFVTQLVEFSFTRSGDVLVKLRVPYLYRDQASKLKDAYGVMLECELRQWSQAEEARRNG